MRYELITPFETKSPKRHLTELELRDHVTAGDILEARRIGGHEDAFKVGIALIARVSGLLPEDIHNMDMRDCDAIDKHIDVIRSPKEAAEPPTK